MDNISVIIRNRNEERYIGYAIQSVLDFFDSPEIVIVNNNSTDNSISVAKSFTFSDINIYDINSYTPGKSLNYGVTKCSNENILVLSAHSQIISLDYENVLKDLETYCSVSGKQIPIWNGKKITPRYIWSNFGDTPQENVYSDFEKRYFLHNAFCFYKKEILIKHPFDEKLAGKEDRYWINDRVSEGKKFYYSPDNICHHHYTTNGATWKGVG